MGVDVSQIGPADARIIGFGWYELLEEFYSDPKNEEKFQKWLKEREHRKNEEKNYTSNKKKERAFSIIDLVNAKAKY